MLQFVSRDYRYARCYCAGCYKDHKYDRNGTETTRAYFFSAYREAKTPAMNPAA